MTTDAVDEPWRPLSIREADQTDAYDALHPGVPSWLRYSLWEWMKPQVSQTLLLRSGVGGRYEQGGVNVPLLREMERKLRFATPWDGGIRSTGLTAFTKLVHNQPGLMLNVADFLVGLHDPTNRYRRESLDQLDRMLIEAGSAYRVAFEMRPPRLIRRVDATVEQAATRLIAAGKTPGSLLADAWQSTYGLQPNPSHGYRQAVRAVEASAIRAVLPTDSKATLGKVIASLRQGAHNWHLSFTHHAHPERPLEVLIADLALLWEGQFDRHVTEGAPLSVRQEEAETALHLAVTLVQWFTSGSVSRKARTS